MTAIKATGGQKWPQEPNNGTQFHLISDITWYGLEGVSIKKMDDHTSERWGQANYHYKSMADKSKVINELNLPLASL